MRLSSVARALFDPRGRASRAGLLMMSGALLAVEIVGSALIWWAGAPPSSPLIFALKTIFIWIALAAASKRLHDLGLAAWWLPAGASLVFAWATVLAVCLYVSLGIEDMQPAAEGYSLLLAGVATPIVAAILWIQITPGEERDNAFGAQPDASGFAGPPERAPASFGRPA